jgi:(S)-ureidoglycine aminohydrolase
MHELGLTRSVRRADHALITPDTFVRAPLPGMRGATAIVHASPALGASFTEYTAEFDASGCLGAPPPGHERFVFVLDGAVGIEWPGGRHSIEKNGHAFVPADVAHTLTASRASRIIVIEKRYAALEGVRPPSAFVGMESRVAPEPLEGDPSIGVRHLVPDDPVFDCAVNTMTFEPGASLPMVEMHVMEHGLLMLDGGGIYRLGNRWYPVSAGDFIWMAPHCPQWFAAVGKQPARYLIYKDWNRHPAAGGR